MDGRALGGPRRAAGKVGSGLAGSDTVRSGATGLDWVWLAAVRPSMASTVVWQGAVRCGWVSRGLHRCGEAQPDEHRGQDWHGWRRLSWEGLGTTWVWFDWVGSASPRWAGLGFGGVRTEVWTDNASSGKPG